MAGATPQARPRIAGLRRLGFFCTLAAPGLAEAGPWIAPEGDRAIVGGAYSDTEEATVVETDLHIEAPLAARIAVVANHFSRTVTTFDDTETVNESTLSGKYRLFRGAQSVTSVQVGAVWDSAAAGDCGEWGGDVRLLTGASTRSGRYFAAAEAGARVQGADCVHARYEVTLGAKPHPRLLGLAQVFVDDDLAYGETLKAQVSLVGFERRGRGVQLGFRVRVDGGDVIEPTILLKYWSALRR